MRGRRASSTVLDVVTVNEVLVPQVKLAVADDRVRPDCSRTATSLRLRIELEAAVFFPTLGRRFNQRDGAAALFEAIKHSIRISDGSFAELIVFPYLFAGFEVLTNPARIGMAVNMIADENDSAMMVLHHLVFVHRRNFVTRSDPDQLAPGAVTGRHINEVVPDNRRGNHGRASWKRSFPEQLAVLGRDAHHV